MKIIYFSWIREAIGKTEENLPKPSDVNTVHDLLAFLSNTSSTHAAALKERVFIKVAVNQVHATMTVSSTTATKLPYSRRLPADRFVG